MFITKRVLAVMVAGVMFSIVSAKGVEAQDQSAIKVYADCAPGVVSPTAAPCVIKDLAPLVGAFNRTGELKANPWVQTIATETGTRFFGSKGDNLEIVCLRDSGNDHGCDLDISEKTRQLLVLQQLSEVLQGLGKPSPNAAPESGGTVMEVREFCLSETRATVTVQVAQKDTTPPTATGCKGRRHYLLFDNRDGKAAAITVETGPPEHFFLSANVPVTKVDELKYDTSAHSLVERKTPSSLFAALNYAFGDVVDNSPSWNVAKRLFITIMAWTSHPLERFGVGGGIKLWKFGDYLDLSTLTFFVARSWNTTDTAPTGSTLRVGTHYTSEWQVGLGFDVKTALGWLKK
ncbi:MAG TPA: hypothetical protein VOA80_16300 [Thermoanaerobaculia bacterium]|nr:hypothetical protein [Thermoanaerobaculia bacterium]